MPWYGTVPCPSTLFQPAVVLCIPVLPIGFFIAAFSVFCSLFGLILVTFLVTIVYLKKVGCGTCCLLGWIEEEGICRGGWRRRGKYLDGSWLMFQKQAQVGQVQAVVERKDYRFPLVLASSHHHILSSSHHHIL